MQHRLPTGTCGAPMAEPAKTILVVEDDRDVREVALTVLEAAGYRVLEAASGDEAHRLLLAHPDLPVDVLFATGFANLIRPGRDRDLHGLVLRKPYRPGELRRVITVLLEEVG